jgi:flagellar biosynthesis protein FliR
VIGFGPDTILSTFAVFCRVGACLLIAPGFSNSQVPVHIRLYLAIAVSLALAPLLMADVKPLVAGAGVPALLGVIFGELARGLFIGFIARLLFMALQVIAVAVTQLIGLSSMPGTALPDEQAPALANLFSITAATLMFVTGLHGQLIRGLVDSYLALPPGTAFDIHPALADIAEKGGAALLAALRIGAPFIAYSVLVNFAIGVTGKLAPQIPVFFIATPFVMAGGLFLLMFSIHDMFSYFVAALDSWLAGY